MESFIGTLKSELVHHRQYRSRDEARPNLFGSPLLASAGLDRLSHRAHIVVITGSSFRAHDSSQEEEVHIEPADSS
jgi:lauroyl/myristoyl acyltransferase